MGDSVGTINTVCGMNSGDFWTMISAIATVLAVIVALFGRWFYHIIFPIRLSIIDANLKGEKAQFFDDDGILRDTGYFYHLKIKNKNRLHFIEKCNLHLVKIERKNGDIFKEQPMTSSRFMQFSPSELYKNVIFVSFSDEIVVDFGYFQKTKKEFWPCLISYPGNVHFSVRANDIVRYHLKVNAMNYRKSKIYIYEVEWDGVYIYPEDPEQMKEHLTIKRIKNGWFS